MGEFDPGGVSLRFGQFPVQRMVFEPKAFDLLGGATAHKES